MERGAGRPIELLAPARDLECGRAAILSGADALYIGGPRFGARAGAGNSLETVGALVEFARVYRVRVYLALNTLLTDAELGDAVEMIWRAWELGVEGVIVQDYGLLERRLPPVPLIASTQTDNVTPEKVAFLERAGFARVILARELSLAEIGEIRAGTSVELECFVHGALCVGYSGRCAMSQSIGGRSGNRGDCAQPCRLAYDLVDASGAVLARERHLLSLGDLNLSARLGDLLDAGVCAFKIEGRLKDDGYVKNVVAHYRRELDAVLAARGLRRASVGESERDFTPDPSRSFHRPFTEYGIDGRRRGVASHATPKMIGNRVGRVLEARGEHLRIEGGEILRPGDGLAYFDADGRLCGAGVERVTDDGRVSVGRGCGARVGAVIYRNLDRDFQNRLARARLARTIALEMGARRVEGEGERSIALWARDPDGIEAERIIPVAGFEDARDPGAMRRVFEEQLGRLGGTEFRASKIVVDLDPAPFCPAGRVAAWRRELLERLREARARARVRRAIEVVPTDHPYPERRLGFEANAWNAAARAFYARHGVELEEGAAAGMTDLRGRRVMTSRYCILRELDRCLRECGGSGLKLPLELVDDRGRRFPLRFACDRCEMEVYREPGTSTP